MTFSFVRPNSTPNSQSSLALTTVRATGQTGALTATTALFQAPNIMAPLLGLQSTTGIGAVLAIPNIVLLTGVGAVGHLSDDDINPVIPGVSPALTLSGVRALSGTGLFGGAAPAGVPQVLPSSVLNIPAIMKTMVVPGGTCQGAFFNTKAQNGINWYDANVGLMAICQFLSAADLDKYVRPYLDAYVLFLSSDASIADVSYPSGSGSLNVISQVPQATDDGYAATFIRLACKYTLASQNFAWFDTNRGTLGTILDNNIYNNRRANGLVAAFSGSRRVGASDVAYLKDNCEAWASLNDMASILNQRNDTFNGSRYAIAASSIASAIDTTLWTPTGPLSPGFKNSDSDSTLSSTFNPNVVAHAYPQALAVGTLSQRYSGAYSYINNRAPGWESLGYDTNPWMVLGLVAALRADTTRANTQTAAFESLYSSSPTTVAINELGMYQRIKSVLAGLPPA